MTLKDITNIQTGLSRPEENNLDSVVSTWRKYTILRFNDCLTVQFLLLSLGSTMEVFTDTEGTFTGLMFQDNLMKSVFSSYPEVLLVDATYKLTDLRMPVYLMMSINGNGQGEIVLVFLTSVETEQAITKMVHAFKELNGIKPRSL